MDDKPSSISHVTTGGGLLSCNFPYNVECVQTRPPFGPPQTMVLPGVPNTEPVSFFQDECRLGEIANMIPELVVKIADDLVGHHHD